MAFDTPFCHFNKLFDDLVIELKLSIFLDIIDILLKVNTPRGLGIMSTNMNDQGKHT
jgi:hypothetical protein